MPNTHADAVSARRSSATAPLLSVVIIARNEEDYIAACIDSVLAGVAGLESSEVVLVDSCSDDRTVDVARRYAIRIVGLSPAQPLCPAMGRHIGARLTSGRHVLFVDGDTALAPEWIAAALAALEARPLLAAVAGREDQVYYQDGSIIGGKSDYFNTGNREQEVEQLGGNGMYRRTALDEAGSFNPFVRSYEEAELGARLRRAGWRLIRIPELMGRHHTPRPDSPEEYWRRFREHLLTGQGQVLRLAARQGLFFDHARRLNRVLLSFVWLCIGIAVGAAAILTVLPLLLWTVGSMALLTAFCIRSRSVVKPLRMIADWLVCCPPLLLGFCLPPRDPATLRLEEAVASDSAWSSASRPAA